LYGRAGRLTAENGGFRPGQAAEAKSVSALQKRDDETFTAFEARKAAARAGTTRRILFE
jgi:hypothetical protein